MDTLTFAQQLALRYVDDPDGPGITRRRRGRGWSFHAPSGDLLEGEDRARCLALAVPPAWEQVWICPLQDGHLQAHGFDTAGRRQYRYHDRWTEGRRMANFDRLAGMHGRLGRLRRQLDALLADGTDERRRATAAMVRMVDAGMARIGGTRSAAEFGHYGVSTLRREHLDVDGVTVTLDYPAKAGVQRHVEVEDPLLAEVLEQIDLDGDQVFTVHAVDGVHTVTAVDANRMVDELTGGWMTCKDFRTWGGSTVALQARVQGADPVEAVDAAAEALGNTRAVARSSYVHPHVLAEDTAAIEQAWSASRSSSRYDRREQALAKLLDQQPPLLDAWLAAQGRP